ncbi:hypothetical protein FSP39_014688 [Pinctada imbricata]|uniref:Uncharacterized protein n=1 Tax=Pinctada imbricata TaxID=66713 RepID=A0AA88YW66_PINIB|nr:hypothetical protein FSP39_014688 [Pinctada imbricata]
MSVQTCNQLSRAGSFVALTLMNKVQGAPPTDKPPGEAPPSGVTLRDRVTAPIPVDERKSVELNFAKYNELKKYLDIAVEDLNITRQKYNQNPSERLQKDVQNKEKTVKKLEEQLKVLSSTLSHDCQLFYITSNLYQQAKGGCKELQKWAFEIHSTFLVYGAPLKIDKVTDAVVSEIDNVLNTKYDKEDALRCIFQQARNIVQQVVDKLLEEFRAKRDLGFWNLYGAHHLKDNMKLKEEMDVVNKVLNEHLENAQSESDDAKPDRNIAIAWALATFIRGVSQQDKRHNSSLDRIQSFIAKDKKSLLMKPSSLSKKRVVKDHQFILQHFVRVEYCLYCNKPLWGIGYQGYQCQICEQSVHKQCIDKIEDPCTKRKRRPPSGIPGRRTQVPTVNEDASSPGPNTSGNSFVISNLKDRPDEDMERTHSVSSIISRFDPKSMQNDRKKSPSAEESQRKGAEIGRSESLKGRHDKGGRPTRRAKSDIDKDESLMQVLNPSGSSSNSSLRSGESPSNSMDAVNSIPHTIENDSDFEIEPELPTLYSIFDKDVYKKMKPKEKKRQEVINELFYTEKSHVRNLKIMLNLFYKPMSMEANYADLLRTIFPNLEEMIALHGSLNSSMKFRRKENPVVSEVGDLLLKRFDGDDGQAFKKGCALCCRNQSYALDLLKARQRKDTRLANFLNEAESSSLMKKLQLKDFIPKQMMRLTKYPLLIESLLRYTQTSTEEHSRLERALQCSKHILEYVNQAVKDFENQYTLEQLQRKIDKRQLDSENEELRSLYLPSHRLVHEGSLTWNINQRKTVDVHVVLLEDLLVLLQKSDEKYLLKFQSTQLVAGKDDSRFMFSPVLNLKNVLHTNHKATDKRSFFVVSKSQIYELSAHTAEEQRKWIKYIKEAADTFKRADKAVEEKPAASQIISEQKSQLHGIHRPGADDLAHPRVDIVTQEPDLIPPTEVTISDVLTVKPEPVLHPLEKMKRLDEEMKESVEEKKLLTAQVLDIPASEIPQRVQMAVEQDSTSDISDLLLAMAHESGDCLTSLNAAESGLAEADLKMPIPMDKLKEMANRMNQILTNLLEKTRQYAALTASQSPNTSSAVVSNRDEERERLRIELKAAQDELNYLREIQRRVTSSSPNPASKTTERPQSMISEASSSLSEPGNGGQKSARRRDTRWVSIKKEETSDQNEEEIPEEDVEEEEVAEEEESDSEYSEPEMSTPTDLPTVLSDIPSEPLCEVAPPTGEEVEEGKPLALAPDELIHVEEVQEAEINHLSDLTEQVSEIQDAKEIMESESRNGNDTESEIKERKS